MHFEMTVPPSPGCTAADGTAGTKCQFFKKLPTDSFGKFNHPRARVRVPGLRTEVCARKLTSLLLARVDCASAANWIRLTPCLVRGLLSPVQAKARTEKRIRCKTRCTC